MQQAGDASEGVRNQVALSPSRGQARSLFGGLTESLQDATDSL